LDSDLLTLKKCSDAKGTVAYLSWSCHHSEDHAGMFTSGVIYTVCVMYMTLWLPTQLQ